METTLTQQEALATCNTLLEEMTEDKWTHNAWAERPHTPSLPSILNGDSYEVCQVHDPRACRWCIGGWATKLLTKRPIRLHNTPPYGKAREFVTLLEWTADRPLSPFPKNLYFYHHNDDLGFHHIRELLSALKTHLTNLTPSEYQKALEHVTNPNARTC